MGCVNTMEPGIAMSTFAPEFAQFWLAGLAAVAAAGANAERSEDDADREKRALEELAERVSAARTIV